MNTEVAALAEIFETRVTNKLTLMKFNFCNLCVKADPAALLGVKVIEDDDEFDIEKVSTVTKPDDDENVFEIIPKEGAYLKPLEDAIKKEHPEFMFETFQVSTGADSGETVDVLRVIVPELNQARHDVLIKGVDTYKDLFNAQLEAERAIMIARLAPLMLTASQEDKDAVDECLNKTCEDTKKAAEEAAENKKKDLDEALERYLEEQAENGAAKTETDAEAQAGAAFSMKME